MSGGYWNGHKVLDPTELESRFSIEDGLEYLDGVGSEELSDESVARLEEVKEILDRLPAREADFIELYYFQRRKQTDNRPSSSA